MFILKLKIFKNSEKIHQLLEKTGFFNVRSIFDDDAIFFRFKVSLFIFSLKS